MMLIGRHCTFPFSRFTHHASTETERGFAGWQIYGKSRLSTDTDHVFVFVHSRGAAHWKSLCRPLCLRFHRRLCCFCFGSTKWEMKWEQLGSPLIPASLAQTAVSGLEAEQQPSSRTPWLVSTT